MILDGWNSSELSPNATIMDHISSYRKTLGQWKIKDDLNASKQIEELKSKVDNLYSDDDAKTEEIGA